MSWVWVGLGGLLVGIIFAAFSPSPQPGNTVDITIRCPMGKEAICHEMMDAAMIVARKYRKQEGEDG